MNDDVVVAGVSYISSKRASEVSGYTQDYIGQLARSGAIDAKRIGGLWHVSLESLNSYKDKSEESKPVPPQHENKSGDPESFVSLDGKDYISASRASKLSGYNQDYIGQLARSGSILSRQVGNRWYVEKGSLLSYKHEKDSLLAAVQSESVGIKHPTSILDATEAYERPLLNYIEEKGDLMPAIAEKEEREEEDMAENMPISTPVPIRVVYSERSLPPKPFGANAASRHPARKRAGGRMVLAGAALTIVIVLSFGFATLRSQSVYTLKTPKMTQEALLGVSNIVSRIGDVLENWLVRELVYKRNN